MTQIVILDVGHGNCAVIHKGQQCVIVDAGPSTALLEFMLENEINVVEEILISHADTDHIKGLEALLDQENILVRSVRLNSDAAKGSKQWDGILFSLDDRRRRHEIQFDVQLIEGLEIPFFDMVVEILAPSAYLAGKGPGSQDSEGRPIATNTVSAVVRARTTDRSVLFTGDIDDVGLQHLLATEQDIGSDILVFPHHGGNVGTSATASSNRRFTDQLLSAANPEVVVFSISRTRHPNPRPEIIETVKTNSSRKVMCTQMSQHCLDEPPNDEGHLASEFAAGKRSGHCCAGSIVVSDANLNPSIGSHTEFVRTKAPDALCRPPD